MSSSLYVPPRLSRPLGISRRSALKAVAGGVLAAPAILSRGHADTRKVKFTLSWLAEGLFAYVFVAKAGGFWQKRGLDVDISRGYGSMTTPPLIAQGNFDFGLSPVPAVVVLGAKGVDLTSIAIVDYNSAMGIAVLDELPIRHPEDLVGKKVGQTLNSSDAAFFAPFCAKNGIDVKTVNLLNLDARVRDQALVQGQVDAVTGFAGNVVASIAASGKKVRFLLYSDYGVSLYGNIAVLAPPKTVADDPDLCQAFSDGLLDGLKLSLTDPDEAQKLFFGAVPEIALTTTGREFTRIGMGMQRFGVLSGGDAKTNGLGWADLAQLQQTADVVMQYQGEPGAPKYDVARHFSNRFAGRIRMSDAEWATAEKVTASVAAMLKKDG